MDIDENTPEKVDFAFSGEIPSGDEEDSSGDVILKSAEDLVKEQNKDFMGEYSMYDEFVKQKDFNSALPHWKYIYNKYPKSTPNIYIHGSRMFEHNIEKAKTDAEKDKILDDYMKMYDKKIKYFEQHGYNIGRKAKSWLEYKLDDKKRNNPLEGDKRTEVMKVGYEWLKQSVDEQGNESELPILVLLMQTTRSLFKLDQLPKETVINNYDKCNTILYTVIKENKEEQNVADAKEILPYIEMLFSTSGAADCEALVNIFTPQFEENANDIVFIKDMLRRLRRAKCDDSELVKKATNRLYELEPSAEAAFNMAHSYLAKDDMVNAKKYYQQAISQETDPILLASYYYERAYLAYAKDKAYSEARELARKALANDPNLCDANMLIGDIYAVASSSFSGTELEKKAIFWLAVDYYNKARRGEDCSTDAATKASDYKKYFPNKEEAFMENLKEGQSYKIGGWINETTTVRF